MRLFMFPFLLLLLPLVSGKNKLSQIFELTLNVYSLMYCAGDVFFASMKGSVHGRGAFCLSNDSTQIVAPIYDLGD